MAISNAAQNDERVPPLSPLCSSAANDVATCKMCFFEDDPRRLKSVHSLKIFKREEKESTRCAEHEAAEDFRPGTARGDRSHARAEDNAASNFERIHVRTTEDFFSNRSSVSLAAYTYGDRPACLSVYLSVCLSLALSACQLYIGCVCESCQLFSLNSMRGQR